MKNPDEKIYYPINQRGNVLFYILIAVALIGALSFAIMQSNRGSLSDITQERARLLASEIVSYGNSLAQATGQLRLRGVDIDDMCFNHENWGASDYDHSGCDDNFNAIFSTNGGGITWKDVDADSIDATTSPDSLWHIYGDNAVENIGTTCSNASCADLVLIADDLKLDVCLKINDVLGIENPSNAPPTDTDYGTARYIGSFAYTATIGDETGGANLKGRSAGCFQKTAGTAKYAFYQVLLAR